MKLTTRSQYGTILMLYLALRYGKGPVLLKVVAEEEQISEKYLGQIIISLKAAGLVKAFRGPHGGYVLAKPAKLITMKNVVEVLEGSAGLIGEEKALSKTRRETVVVARNLWQSLDDRINEVLNGTTLADLVKQCFELKEQTVMYHI